MKKYISILLIITVFLLCGNGLYVFAENVTNEERILDVENDECVIGCSTLDNDMMETYEIGAGSGDYVQEDTVFLHNFATYYFSQLKENFGYNHKGTCSYIATAMLLSYYDTYWDDSIIEQNTNGIINENWDAVKNGFNISKSLGNNDTSPGIKNEKNEILSLKQAKGLSSTEKLSDSDYDAFVLLNANTYFHLELVRLGRNVLEMEYGIYPRDIFDLLEYYLYTVKGYNSSDVTINYKNWADFEGNKKDYIIEKVKQKIPVIVSGGNISLDPWGHTYIIYDYDEINDELYCHMGWHNQINSAGKYDTSHVSFSSIEGTLIGGAITLEFHTEHSCSNNYVDSNGNAYCSCYFPCHPEHEHTYEQIEGDASQHKYTCGCAANDVNTAYHSFTTYESVDETYHTKTCADCGYSVTDEHAWSYRIVSDLMHEQYCADCGYVAGTSRHVLQLTGATDNYKICSACGAMIYIGGNEIFPVSPTNEKGDEEETE